MALGPKAMGDAIIANLENKTGKNLEAWLSELKRLNPADKKDAKQKLITAGLGLFQAVTVAEHYFGGSAYITPDSLVNALFARFPEQRALFDAVCEQIVDGKQLRLQPCKNYVPIYSVKNTIVASFKPTARGLYLALRGHGFSFATVPHKRSFGGSETMREGIYPDSALLAVQAIREAQAQAL
jgi:hypothetical protein